MNGPQPGVNPFRQPKAVFAVAFACVVSFMGIGLVDPILPAISSELDASPSEVTLLFTSYLVVTAVAMLITNFVSSRIGAKKTLIAGLVLIVIFAGLAGSSGSVSDIIWFRGGWGIGNALFIATSLAVIVASASGGMAGAIVLYETALGLGIAVGPLLGGTLGTLSWRGPFYGVSALMAIALIATIVLVEKLPKPPKKTSLAAPLKALRHRGLLTMSLTALCYNWGFFTVLGYAPFPMKLSPIQLGLVFFGWGILVALFAVFGAPRLQSALGIAKTMYVNLFLFALCILGIALWTTERVPLIVCTILTGIFIGVNNTITTQAVMTVSPVERPVASAAYSFVRFIGGGLAPYVAGRLVLAVDIHFPFYLGAAAVLAGMLILATGHRLLADAERAQAEDVPAPSAAAPASPAVPAAPVARAPVAPAPVAPVAPRGGVFPVGVNGAAGIGISVGGAILAAIDSSPVAGLVTGTAARLASGTGRVVHVVHAQEAGATGADGGVDGETMDAARAVVRDHLERLAASGVPAEGHVLLHTRDHGAAGRLLGEYANETGVTSIIMGPPSHNGLATLMDESASAELRRHARARILVVGPVPNRALAPGLREHELTRPSQDQRGTRSPAGMSVSRRCESALSPTAHSICARSASRNSRSSGSPASPAARTKQSTNRRPRSDMSPLPACIATSQVSSRPRPSSGCRPAARP
ncbi:MAG: MFS transporter [Nocardiopsaceae bacterium]|nr:MFS transporter [Nocardiopsaceae bacterium]